MRLENGNGSVFGILNKYLNLGELLVCEQNKLPYNSMVIFYGNCSDESKHFR